MTVNHNQTAARAPSYRRGRIAAEGLERDGITRDDLPVECPYTLDQILDPDWWPASRNGLE